MKYITMTLNGIYGSTIDAQSDEEARTILEGPGHHEEILDIQDASPIDSTGADFIVIVPDEHYS
jgi:hypothetical protein